MNKITLDKIEKNEVLRYLGCSNESSLDENILDEIERAADVTLSLVTPRAVFAYFTLETLEKAHFFDGNDIRLHLNGCMGAILLAVTIGGAIERATNFTDRVSLLSENGAKTVLVPMDNLQELSTIPATILGKTDVPFYASAQMLIQKIV